MRKQKFTVTLTITNQTDSTLTDRNIEDFVRDTFANVGNIGTVDFDNGGVDEVTFDYPYWVEFRDDDDEEIYVIRHKRDEKADITTPDEEASNHMCDLLNEDARVQWEKGVDNVQRNTQFRWDSLSQGQ